MTCLRIRFVVSVMGVLTTLTQPVYAQKAGRPIYFTDDGFGFSATGKWVPADPNDKPAFPSETEIDCEKIAMSCVEATAEIYSGHPHVTISYLHAIKWDRDGIVATSSSGTCMTNTILISFAEKEITETYSMKQLDDKTKEACNDFGATRTTTSLFVLKGSGRWNADPSTGK
jgi:hypothetical protein